MTATPRCSFNGCQGKLVLKFPPQVYECDTCRVGTVGPPRLRCEVPFCNHTRGPRKGDTFTIVEGVEWICGDHWRPVPQRWRRALNRSRQAYEAAQSTPAWRRNNRLWRRCKRLAIEAAAGLR